MPILPIDSGRYGTKEMKTIFEEETKLRYELTFEAEVADAQAKLNMIPTAAADDIKNVVLSNRITVQRVKELESVSDHDIAAIVEAISEQCLESSKPWIHYGLTSNDVVDSSTSMQMRDVFRIIEEGERISGFAFGGTNAWTTCKYYCIWTQICYLGKRVTRSSNKN